MEKKSMGQFIAVLRKAKGMTQRELAESLGVSDKAVSRWERDECAPDISALPILAEIFDITVDELLRGERSAKEDAPTRGAVERSEKQLKRLLKLSREKYLKRSIISVGIALVGLIAASVCNFAFLRSYLGFFISLVFLLAALICQSFCSVDAFSLLRDSELEEGLILGEKKHYINSSYAVFATILLIFALCSVFGISGGAYYGIVFEDWLTLSFVVVCVSVVILSAVYGVLIAVMKKKGVYPVSEREKEKAPELRSLFRRYMLKSAVLFMVTIVVSGAISSAVTRLGGRKFTDLEEFKQYMETPVEHDGFEVMVTMTASASTAEVLTEEPENNSYYTDDGYLAGDEVYETDYVYSKDGETVLLEYECRNENVCLIEYEWDGDKPVLLVKTYTDMADEGNLKKIINALSVLVLIAEGSVLLISYTKKRKLIIAE